MSNTPMMKCGHAANAVTGPPPGMPCCAICGPDGEGWNVVDDSPPDLEGRRARCPDCGRVTKSSYDLPFFEYLGPNSPKRLCMHCGYGYEAHSASNHACPIYYKASTNYYAPKPIPGANKWAGKTYEPSVYLFDKYYCGCKGWD